MNVTHYYINDILLILFPSIITFPFVYFIYISFIYLFVYLLLKVSHAVNRYINNLHFHIFPSINLSTPSWFFIYQFVLFLSGCSRAPGSHDGSEGEGRRWGDGTHEQEAWRYVDVSIRFFFVCVRGGGCVGCCGDNEGRTHLGKYVWLRSDSTRRIWGVEDGRGETRQNQNLK